MKLFLYLAAILYATFTYAQNNQGLRIEPPYWWANMPTTELQLQLYGEGLGNYRASIDYPGVTIKRQLAVDSPNYLFVYLEIEPSAQVGAFDIELRGDESSRTISYELRERESDENRNQGFDASDVIYLMMPDRFANGDSENDSIPGMLEDANRDDPTKRQGGDIQGILDHLNYIANLGMTAVWFTPIFENDMPPEYGAYHGYAATDLYRVDRRFGTNEQYKNLVEATHAKGMKVIMDMIHNHIGLNHWWMKDLPTKDWVHDLDKVGLTNFRGTIPADPYASQADSDRLVKGWFVPEMPDLNQRNPLLADYLIQNTIWWIEDSGIDGIRMDTYLYPYADYMKRWAKEVIEMYPNFNIIGEAWVETVAHESFWQYDLPGVDDGYNSHLPSVTDFPFCFAIRKGLGEEFQQNTGISRLYYLLSQDALYADPSKNVIFLDNHDMGRIYEELNQDKDLFKIAYALLMTSRGIPQVYYGTELMMEHENRGGDDEGWRQTMPGGWPEDGRSVFTSSGRTQIESEILEYTRAINQWRKSATAIHSGKLVHFVPENNTYVYFRTNDSQSVMVIVNMNSEEISIQTSRFNEILSQFSKGVNIITEQSHSLLGEINMAARSCLILELK